MAPILKRGDDEMYFASQKTLSLLWLVVCVIMVTFPLTGCSEDDQSLYWEDGTLMYSGDMVDGVPHGFGTWYYPDGKTAYEGEWRDGRMHGEGVVFCCQDGSTVYTGEFNEGACDGWGVRYEAGELFYEGEWEGGLICGD